jgi:hypothetical protein
LKTTLGAGLLACLFVLACGPTQALALEPDTRHPAGELHLRSGVLINIHHYADDDAGDKGLGLGFVELGYRTPEWAGLHLGALWYGFGKLWERHAGDFDACCVKQQDLREFYAQWRTPFAGTTIQAGRFRMHMSGLDGHSHQGVQITSEPRPGIGLRAAVIERWIDNDLVIPNYKGMSGWRDVGDGAHPDAGRELWLASARFGIGERAWIQPFAAYQARRMLLHGIDAAYTQTLANGHSLGIDGTLAIYGNRTPRDVQPDYEDVLSWLIHAAYGLDDVTLGLGWYGVSDHRGDLGAGIFDWIDPMTVDEIMPYDDHNHARLLFADALLDLAPLELEVRYGHGVNRALDMNSQELNLMARYAFTPRLKLSSLIAYNRYTGRRLPDHTRAGLLLTLAY